MWRAAALWGKRPIMSISRENFNSVLAQFEPDHSSPRGAREVNTSGPGCTCCGGSSESRHPSGRSFLHYGLLGVSQWPQGFVTLC
jgi:hypothetical protein